MGNVEAMTRGDVQMTSGGTGIRHSEYNGGSDEVHFLQIWALPNERHLKPRYYARHFTDAEKANKWAHIVAPVDSTQFGVVDERDGKGPTPIHSAVNFFASMIDEGKTVDHNLVPRLRPSESTANPEGKLVYLQVTQCSGYNEAKARADGAQFKVSLGGEEATLGEGDGVFIRGAKVGDALSVSNVGKKTGEVVLFEMDP